MGLLMQAGMSSGHIGAALIFSGFASGVRLRASLHSRARGEAFKMPKEGIIRQALEISLDGGGWHYIVFCANLGSV